MEPITTAALISGGLSAIGGLFTNRSQKKIARETMAFEAQQAQKQMDFQERMSSSAHQREVADLRAAGLNPILSATGGAGSSTPAGASGSGVSADVTNWLAEGVNSAMAARMNKMALSKMEWDATDSMYSALIRKREEYLQGVYGEEATKLSLERQRKDNEVIGRQANRASLENLFWEKGAEALAPMIDKLVPGNSGKSFFERLMELRRGEFK